MQLSIIYDEEQDRYYVKDNDQLLGLFWNSKCTGDNYFHFVHSNPFAITGDQLIAVGEALNKLNKDIERHSNKVHLRCL